MRRQRVLLANDLLRGSDFLSQELPGSEDGWRQRWRPLRESVVLLAALQCAINLSGLIELRCQNRYSLLFLFLGVECPHLGFEELTDEIDQGGFLASL